MTVRLWGQRRGPILACLLFGAVALTGCGRNGRLSDSDKQAIATDIEREVRAAYDLSKPDVEGRLLSLYPRTGRVVSASDGIVRTSPDSIRAGIRYFWETVGANMHHPRWVWDRMLIDVLAPDAAVMTATYHVPHFTPKGAPHVLGGAWTAVFQKRGGRWLIVQEHLSDLPPAAAMSLMDTP